MGRSKGEVKMERGDKQMETPLSSIAEAALDEKSASTLAPSLTFPLRMTVSPEMSQQPVLSHTNKAFFKG